MRYSIERKDRIYVKGYGFLTFAKNIDKTLSTKYSQNLLDNVENSTRDAIKTSSRRAIEKTAEATGEATQIQLKQKRQNLIREYENKDIYLQKNDSKLLMSYD